MCLLKEIRQALLGDANGIAKTVEEVWDQTIDLEVYRSHVESDICAIWIAVEENDEIAGFVSAFLIGV